MLSKQNVSIPSLQELKTSDGSKFKYSRPQDTLARLPNEIIWLVCSYLTIHEIGVLGRSSRFLYFLTRVDAIWHSALQGKYPHDFARITQNAKEIIWCDEFIKIANKCAWANSVIAKHNKMFPNGIYRGPSSYFNYTDLPEDFLRYNRYRETSLRHAIGVYTAFTAKLRREKGNTYFITKISSKCCYQVSTTTLGIILNHFKELIAAYAYLEKEKINNKIRHLIWSRDKKHILEKTLSKHAGHNDYNLSFVSDFVIKDGLSATEFIPILLANGADPNVKNRDGLTPLHLAVKESNKRAVKYLLEGKSDVNALTDTGMTPLHYCYSSYSIFKLLIEHDADIRAVDAHGETPLHRSNGKVALGLIEMGANMYAANRLGQTPARFNENIHLLCDFMQFTQKQKEKKLSVGRFFTEKKIKRIDKKIGIADKMIHHMKTHQFCYSGSKPYFDKKQKKIIESSDTLKELHKRLMSL